MLFAIRAEDVYPAAKQAGGVVATDRTNKALSPDLPHGVQNVPAEGALGVAKHYRRTFAPQGQQALWNDHSIVQPALTGAGSADFEVPTVITSSQILLLLT